MGALRPQPYGRLMYTNRRPAWPLVSVPANTLPAQIRVFCALKGKPWQGSRSWSAGGGSGSVPVSVSACFHRPGYGVRWRMNQSRASPAAVSRVPGSSNRWLAPGTTARWFSQRSSVWALRLRSSTTSSRPPTISSVGAVTAASRGRARSGRPPRDTTAAMPAPGSAAAHSAAAAPGAAAGRRAPRAGGGPGDRRRGEPGGRPGGGGAPPPQAEDPTGPPPPAPQAGAKPPPPILAIGENHDKLLVTGFLAIGPAPSGAPAGRRQAVVPGASHLPVTVACRFVRDARRHPGVARPGCLPPHQGGS